MNILTVCGIALISVAATAVIRETRPSLAPYVTAACGVFLLGYIIVSSAPIIEFLPIVTPGSTTVEAPIKTLSPIVTRPIFVYPRCVFVLAS